MAMRRWVVLVVALALTGCASAPPPDKLTRPTAAQPFLPPRLAATAAKAAPTTATITPTVTLTPTPTLTP